jgi:hypothetical protein
MTAADRLLPALTRLLDRRAKDRSPVRPARVVGRNPDGTERLQRLDAACVTRGAAANHLDGQVITVPSTAVLHRTGAAGLATLTETAAAETLWIESLDPADLRPGETYTLTVTGRGFDAAVRIDFLEPTPDLYVQPNRINESVTLLSLQFVDTTTLLLQIAVAPDARLYPGGAPIAFGRAL